MIADIGAESFGRHGGMSSRAPVWFSPGVLILAPVSLSFLAWSALVASQELGQPATSEALTGFSAPANVSGSGIALLAFWYCAIVMVSTVGFWLGTQRSRPTVGDERTNTAAFERRYFFLLRLPVPPESDTRS